MSEGTGSAHGPGLRVWSREIVDGFDGGFVAQAFEPRLVVVGDELHQVGVAVFVCVEAPVMAGGVSRQLFEMLCEPTIEALDHTVGLRTERPRQLVRDTTLAAEAIDRMITGRAILRFVLLVDRESIGPFTAVVGENGVDLDFECFEEAAQEGSRGLAFAIVEYFDVDEAGCSIDGDVGVRTLAMQRRQILHVEMDKAGWRLDIERGDRLAARLRSCRHAMALQATMDLAARQLGVHASAQYFDNVIERQPDRGTQLDGEPFLNGCHRRGDSVWAMRTIIDAAAIAPARDCALADAELDGQFTDRGGAVLDVRPGFRRRGGVGVQSQLHDPRRSLMKAMPRATPILSSQSPGTKHLRRDDVY